MATLRLKSQREIQTDIIVDLIAKLGLNDVNPASVLDILTNAVAQEDFQQYVEMAKILRLTDLDAITGEDLDNKAFEFGLSRRGAVKSSGKIDILRPSGFEKVSTTFYAGARASIEGDTEINVNDASNPLIGSSGTLIIGRGSANEEEVTYSVAPTNNTNFFTYTLDTPLTKSHAIEETIILKQGNNETIEAGTLVRVPATGTTAEIQFETTNDVTLLAGEDKIGGVEVIAVVAGSDGNIAIKAIEGTEAFSSEPFAGARAENNSKFTTGQDRETDDELRDKIKSHVQSLSRGVKEAIRDALVGLVDEETAKRIVSTNIILPQDDCGPVKIYIDDGTGFEPDFESKGFEEVLRNSTGGETRLQLDSFPLVKAQVETNVEEPFDLSTNGLTLTYNIGTQSETVTFALSDFEFPEAATAEEVVRAINDRSLLIEARTSQAGSRITINAKSDINENIQVTGGTVNPLLNFPTDLKQTLYLYVNDILVDKDGSTALIDSGNQGPFNFQAVGAFPHTLTLIIDKKSANPQTITFNSSDFNDITAINPLEIITVMNAQMVGAVAALADNGTRVRITSNTLLSSGSAIQITGGTANNVTNGLNFDTIETTGVDGVYSLNKELGTIEFFDALPANVSVTAGSLFTRAKLRAGTSENYAPADLSTLIIAVDGGVDQTITFDNTFLGGVSAADTATFINSQLKGATAISREIGTINFLEINSNSYDSGTIEIKSSSTANNVFQFKVDTVVSSQRPHAAFRVSQNSSPYAFAQNDTLVLVMNDDIVNSTFSIIMSFDGATNAVTDSSNFAVSTFSNVFDSDSFLNGFDVAFTSGANTINADINQVSNVSGSTWRYSFASLPVNLSNIVAGDLIKIESLSNNSNNGFFVITNVNTTGNGYIEITNDSGTEENSASGIGVLSQKRSIASYTQFGGLISTTVPFVNTPTIGDELIVLPSSNTNVVDYLNNIKITSLSLKAGITGVNDNTQVQIESLLNGSDGVVQITGGKANNVLNFSTDIYRGLQGYQLYTGLLKLAHRTIYGDDTDLVAFPGIGAAGIKFIFLAPTVNEVSINVNVTLAEGVSIASLENEIKSAILSYINNLGIGDDIIIEEIRSAVQQIRGVTDTVLNSPTTNIAISDNELARSRDSLILVG
jgi:uncharacterized phage protein gp47/JayE